MERLTIRLIIAVLTFIIGIAAVSAWFTSHQSPDQSGRLLSGPPCREGLVSVEPQLNAPLQIKISEATCDNPQEANVYFVVENISSKPIIRFVIRSIKTYERLVNDGSSVTIEGASPVQPRHTINGFLGGGVRTRGGEWVGELQTNQLTVWSVTFADGTTWEQGSSR